MPKPKKRKPQRNSRIADHKRQGKILRAPMLAAMGDAFRAVSWARDQLPDFLWTCSHLASGDPADLVQLCKWLDNLVDVLGKERDGFPDHWLLTGRLTSFDAIPADARQTLLTRLSDDQAYEMLVPEGFAHALGMYPSAPGRWLIQPWVDAGLVVDPARAQRYLAPVVAASLDGREPVATRAKAVVFRQLIQAGRLSLPSSFVDEMADVIVRYPMQTTPEETARVESFIRASFQALEGARDVRPESEVSPTEWANTFWRSNWRLYPCERRRPLTARAPLSDQERATAEAAVEDLRAEVRAVRDRFVLLADQTDPDIYAPDRYEVLTGLVARVLRYLSVYVGYPSLWTMEHGAPLLRTAIETRIIVRYLSSFDSDPVLFRRFKAYGMGRLKLLKLHFEEYLAAEDDPHEDMVKYVEYLDALVNQDIMEEFQDIDLGGNFAGKDMRKLAADVGLEREYRLLFAPASSNVHGEWSVIDEYALERCINPLHMGHRVVRHDVAGPTGSMVIETVIDFVHELVDEYQSATAEGRSLMAQPSTGQTRQAADRAEVPVEERVVPALVEDSTTTED